MVRAKEIHWETERQEKKEGQEGAEEKIAEAGLVVEEGGGAGA